ncbi:GNAT family N-acetyltransferase [Paenibacillus sp. FSL M8-0212]|uniref:GNAT family N-acetyltransferase n=1 Tax=Paenibacillus sp. FSL M8-0212 TaxID=2921618 RepID=UPI0030F868DC
MNEDRKQETYIIRNIQRDEADIYWPFRLEALKTHPEAFGASFELSVQIPMNEVQERIHNEHGLKLRHKGMIWGVYVAPPYRGSGLASRLLREVLDRGRHLEGIKQINLSVVTTNESARRLYERYEFEVYGIERNALEVNGQGYDEAHMNYFYTEHSTLNEDITTGGVR